MAMHRIQQKQSPIVLLGAGLPILPGLAGDSKSYAERLFSFPDVGALSQEDVARALQEPARREGAVLQMMLLIKYMNLLMDIRIFYKNGDIRLGNRRKLKILHWM